jgi:hypothetical protein
MDSMDAAKTEHHLKGDKSKIRNLTRNKAVAVTLEGLAGMIPEQDGLGILRGGLKLVFKVR